MKTILHFKILASKRSVPQKLKLPDRKIRPSLFYSAILCFFMLVSLNISAQDLTDNAKIQGMSGEILLSGQQYSATLQNDFVITRQNQSSKVAVNLNDLRTVAANNCGTVVDQQSLSNTTCMALFSQTDLAQSFVPSLGTMSGASILLSSNNAGIGDVTIALYDNLPNAGGVLLASGTALGVLAGNWADAIWPEVPVTPGNTYYIVFTGTNSNQCVAGDTSNPYPDGIVFANSGYTPFLGFDYTFKTISGEGISISCSADITKDNDPGVCGAVITYADPTVIDNCSFNITEVIFNYTGAIENWTVPAGVTSVRIEAIGAAGGNSNWSAINDHLGGLGALVSGDVIVSGGDILQILVGQKGESGSVGGGGGGSFVATTVTPLMIAGGGGGASSDYDGVDAVTTNNGTTDSQNLIPGGTAGNGGEACTQDTNNGGGGGGFFTNGLDANNPNAGLNWGRGGAAFVNGGAGGIPGRGDGACNNDAFGGFGGGGSTTCNTVGGGGGGGYSGGAGGPHISNCSAPLRSGGGGGGSFNAGTNQLNSESVGTGNGQIIITYNTPLTVTQTNGFASGSIFPVGTTTNTFTVTDSSGNTATCSFDVTVEDSEAPVAACKDITVELGANSMVSITAGAIDNGSSDNCGIASVTASQTEFGCDELGPNTVTLTVTDVNGLVSSCTATVTVVDNRPQGNFDGDARGDLCDEDDDNDGCLDIDDPHPFSIQSATIVIGSCNSGVANQSLGCSTMADILMDACLYSGSRNAYIVSVYRTLQGWLRAGIINRAQQTAIYSCAVRNYFNCGSYNGNGTNHRMVDTSFDEPTLDFGVKTWPNPTSNDFNIKVSTGNQLDKVDIQVMDITGKRVHANTFDSALSYRFGDNLQAGVYFVRISQGEFNKTLRVIKQ